MASAGVETKAFAWGADSAHGTRRVFIRELEVMLRVGVHAHEKLGPQPVVVSVDMTVQETPTAGLPDKIDTVVCYERVVRRIEALAESGHVNLIETLAERIVAAAFEDERVLGVRVCIAKPKAFANAHSVGIEIERHRAGT